MKRVFLAIVGPTCSGKSKYAKSVARQFHLESINLDSFQLYSFFQLGTGRSDNIPNGHLYGVIDPHEDVNEESYLKLVEPVIESILSRGSLPLFEGGSLTLLHALLSRYKLEIIGVKLPAQINIKRSIKNRIDAMGEDNLVDEVREGLRRGYRDTRVMKDDIVYLPLVRYLDGVFTRGQAFEDMQAKWEKMHMRQLKNYSELNEEISWVESSGIVDIKSMEYVKRKRF